MWRSTAIIYFSIFVFLLTKEMISPIVSLFHQNKKAINFIDYDSLSIIKIITVITYSFYKSKFAIDLSKHLIL